MTIPILVVAGPSGCGKSSVAQALSDLERFAFVEGDELHPRSNIEKMSNGTPLQDEDRWAWLDTVREKAIEMALAPDALGVIITCSSLKKNYRDVLSKANTSSHDVSLSFIFLNVSKKELIRRMEARQGHYMKSGMLDSQLNDLELPDPSEQNCHVVDSDTNKAETEEKVKKIANEIIASLKH